MGSCSENYYSHCSRSVRNPFKWPISPFLYFANILANLFGNCENFQRIFSGSVSSVVGLKLAIGPSVCLGANSPKKKERKSTFVELEALQNILSYLSVRNSRC